MSFKGYFHCLYAILTGHRKKHSTVLKNLGSITKVFLLASTLKRKNLSGMSLWSHADRKVFAIIQSNRVFIPIHMLNYSKVSKSLNKKQSQRFSEVERVKSNYRYSGAPNDNFRKIICSEDDLRSRIFGSFSVKFLACLLLLGFSNIKKNGKIAHFQRIFTLKSSPRIFGSLFSG